MVEKSTYMILVLTSIVLMLSFKDLILIRSDSPDAAKQKQAKQHELNLDESLRSNEGEDSYGDESDINETHDDSNDDDDLSDDEHHHHHHHHDHDGAAFEKKIPTLKIMKGGVNIQTLKFKFCYSCGYRNAFEHYSQLIQTRFPELKIVGENYSPATWKLYLAQFLSTTKMMLIGCIIFGFNPFTQFNLQTPAVFNWAITNKFYASIMLFFLSNSIETHLISTGAFEIYLNDIQIWSKLESDRMPHEKELMQILDMNFNFESEKNAAFGSAKF